MQGLLHIRLQDLQHLQHQIMLSSIMADSQTSPQLHEKSGWMCIGLSQTAKPLLDKVTRSEQAQSEQI